VLRRAFSLTLRPAFLAARAAVVDRLERREGIVTTGEVEAEDLGLGEHGIRYKPSGWLLLRRALRPGDVRPDDVFLDLGCGKGRVVCQAATRYRFRRVLGVDASADMVSAAVRNVEATRARHTTPEVKIVHSDVTDYAVPDDVTVVYLYNPFVGPVFAAAIRALVESQERRPRRIRVVYATPLEERALLEAGFRLVRRHRGWRPGREWSRSNAIAVFERP
jgi:SAM-dependent methyltransferase